MPITVTTPSALILGDSGVGKSTSLTTYLDAGIETFIVITEPNGLDSVLDAVDGHENLHLLHWAVVSPTVVNIATLMEKAKIVNTKDAGAIQQMNMGLAKNKYQQFAKFLSLIQNFQCDRSGEFFGDVTTWGDNRALCVDSLTGINMMVSQYVAGARPTLTMPEYGLVQNITRDTLNLLCSLNCFFALTAHMDSGTDEFTGLRKAFPLSVGKALAPEIPRFFSEVILAKKNNGKFSWSTNDDRAVTKSRALIGENLDPSFVQLVEAHKKRKAKFPELPDQIIIKALEKLDEPEQPDNPALAETLPNLGSGGDAAAKPKTRRFPRK